jgi:N-formylmaleamate deformylase
VAERLGRTFDTYVLDVRGRGLSEGGEHLDYGLDACAADLCAFLKELNLGKAAVLGHSNGARIAVRAARLDSTHLERIVLLDPPVSGPGRRAYPSALAPILALLEAARRGEAWGGLRKSPLAPWPEDLQRLRAEWLHTCDPRAAEVTHRDFHEQDFHSDLAALAIPAALIAAGKGGVILEGDEEEIRRIRPDMPFLRVPNAGHQVQVDDFEGFLRALGQVLGRNL